MADACGSDSIFSKVAIDGSASPTIGSWTSADIAFQILPGSNLSFNEDLINTPTLNGRIVEDDEITTDGLKSWDGGFGVLWSPDSINTFIPYVLGGAWSSNTSTPTDAAPPDINVLQHKDAYLYPYTLGKVATWTLSGEQGKAWTQQFTFMGRDRLTLASGASWPSGLDVNLSVPYMFENCVVTVGGTVVKCNKITITRDNMLGTRFWGSTTPDCIKRNDRTKTTISLRMPHSTDIVPLFVNHTARTSKNVVLTFTHPTSTMSCTINLPYTQFPRRDPPAGGGEIVVEATGTARGHAGAREISIVNDNIP